MKTISMTTYSFMKFVLKNNALLLKNPNRNNLIRRFVDNRKSLSTAGYLFNQIRNLSSTTSTTTTTNNSNNKSHTEFDFDVSKFNDIHIRSNNIIKFVQQADFTPAIFESSLKNSIEKWKSEKRTSVWVYLPLDLANLAAIAGKYGFKYHHAENDLAVLFKWLPENTPSKIPLFATHQMGVAGVVYRADTNQILVIKDRIMVKDFWKLPGGAADLGEDIQNTAVREVFEETGIKTKFCSVIAFRQQHNYPSAHGRSDLYVICRLEPLSYEINACTTEVKMCKWMDLNELCEYKENRLTRRVANLIKYGKQHGFEHIDIVPSKMNSPFAGRFYNLFHRRVNLEEPSIE